MTLPALRRWKSIHRGPLSKSCAQSYPRGGRLVGDLDGKTMTKRSRPTEERKSVELVFTSEMHVAELVGGPERDQKRKHCRAASKGWGLGHCRPMRSWRILLPGRMNDCCPTQAYFSGVPECLPKQLN